MIGNAEYEYYVTTKDSIPDHGLKRPEIWYKDSISDFNR